MPGHRPTAEFAKRLRHGRPRLGECREMPGHLSLSLLVLASTHSFSRPISRLTHASSAANCSGVIQGCRNRVNITSLASPFSTIRIGTAKVDPVVHDAEQVAVGESDADRPLRALSG